MSSTVLYDPFLTGNKGKHVAFYQLIKFFVDAFNETTTTFLCFTQNVSAGCSQRSATRVKLKTVLLTEIERLKSTELINIKNSAFQKMATVPITSDHLTYEG